MASFKWKDLFSVGHQEIDDQHKELLEIGNDLMQLAIADKSHDYYDKIMELLEKLKNYTIFHFSHEEELMRKTNYPLSELHIEQHISFVDQIQKIERKDIDGQQQQAIMDILSFVAGWVGEHIVGHDKQFGQFLLSQ